jgi:phospholipid/cholesterol/gamma-HCH transport system substrate-binding protein
MKLPSVRLPSSRRGFLTLAGGVVAVVALVSAGIVFWPHSSDKTVTAYFTETTGLYTGDQVTVLGVQVGNVQSITPESGRVKVVLSYDSNISIPANAEAAIVTPTLVTTRTVQLTPAYKSGATLPDGGAIPESRTAVPVEWDQIESELNTLASALGPNQKNSSGALNQVLNTSAANLNGEGTNINQTLNALTQATTTLSDDRGNLFATVDNLQKFVGVLDDANTQVGQFNQELSSVSGVLSDNKTELAHTLSTLNSSLSTITAFVKNNRTALSTNLSSLNGVLANLNQSDQNLANALQLMPTEASNFNNIYDPDTHSIDGALAVNNLQDPAEFVCSTIFSIGGQNATTTNECTSALAPLVNVLGQDSLPVSVDPANTNGYNQQTSSTGSSSSSSDSSSSGSGSTTSGSSDSSNSLGGLVQQLTGGN